MTPAQFIKAFYAHRQTPTSEAAYLHLVRLWGLREACRQTGADPGSVSRLCKELKSSRQPHTIVE